MHIVWHCFLCRTQGAAGSQVKAAQLLVLLSLRKLRARFALLQQNSWKQQPGPCSGSATEVGRSATMVTTATGEEIKPRVCLKIILFFSKFKGSTLIICDEKKELIFLNKYVRCLQLGQQHLQHQTVLACQAASQKSCKLDKLSKTMTKPNSNQHCDC